MPAGFTTYACCQSAASAVTIWPMSDNDAVNLFWTGGCDSTFQLLQLLLVEKRRVQPYYIIEPERPSTRMELLTMRRIKARLLEEHPQVRELMLPTRFFAAADIAPDAEITAAFRSVTARRYIGTQYEWLARFCRQHGFTDMQMAIAPSRPLTADMVSRFSEGGREVFRVDPAMCEADDYQLFRYYTFPTFDLNKFKTDALARERGWHEIMNMTWFCHKPRRGMKPCGKCHPCLETIKIGLAWRVPLRSRIASLIFRYITQPSESLTRKTLARCGLLDAARKLRKKLKPD